MLHDETVVILDDPWRREAAGGHARPTRKRPGCVDRASLLWPALELIERWPRGLQGSRIEALIRQGVAAGMPKHVRVHPDPELGSGSRRSGQSVEL
jgi:hypothetical protein